MARRQAFSKLALRYTQQGAKKQDAQKDEDAHTSELNWHHCAGTRWKTASNHIVDNDLADATVVQMALVLESQRMLTREYLKSSADGPLHSNRHLPHIYALTTITKSPIWAGLQHLANLGGGRAKRLMLLWMYPGMRSKSWAEWQVSHRAAHITVRNINLKLSVTSCSVAPQPSSAGCRTRRLALATSAGSHGRR